MPNKVSLWESMIHWPRRSLCGRVWYIPQQGLFEGDYDTLPSKVFLRGSMIHCATRSLCGSVWYIDQQGLSVWEYDTLSNSFIFGSVWYIVRQGHDRKCWRSLQEVRNHGFRESVQVKCFSKNPSQVNDLNEVASLTSVWHKSSILQLVNMESRLLLWCFNSLTKDSKSLAELNGSQSEIINFYSLPIYYLENEQILYI